MPHPTLLLILDRPEREAEARAAAQRAWSVEHAAAEGDLRVTSLQVLREEEVELKGVAIAWLWLSDAATAEGHEFDVAAALHDRRVPLAVARPAGVETPTDGSMLEAGVVALSAGADPAVAYAVLSALAAGGEVTRTMSREVRMLHAQSSGMAGQFDKIDEELRMALKIQREFLPKALPDIEGLDFDVLWRPASYVSGDIYDVQRLDEDHVGVFIADAVGHGVPAALMTIYIKQAMVTRQITPGVGPGYRIVPPGEAIAGLNRAMIQQDAGAASLGTAAYGILNTQTQRFTVARAGHPAPLLLRGNGETQWLEPDGAMLGIFPDEVFENLTFDLEDDDRLLLYSDGFEVAFPGKGSQGRLANEHFTEEFEGLRHGSGQEALDFLQGRLDLQSGSLNQRDDLTVVCTSVRALADVAANRNAADGIGMRSVA